ncbi:unnamed protein product [Soboliphyme baturini]|uniref:FOXO-TAD domain-containing protein n=1 Tax=Soboliphyme baturini TaxID=241478 RepID=A0A183IR63_9BILA|nr:unnamed protein product [Soboliphyme baturini]
MMPFALSPSGGEFRHRSNSNVSNYSVSSCMSPKYDSRIDDWGDDVRSLQQHQAQAPTFLPGENFSSDLVESMSQSMNLNEPPPYPAKNPSGSTYTVFAGGDESSPSRIHTSPGKFIVAATAAQRQQQQQFSAAGAIASFPRKNSAHGLSGGSSLSSGGLCNITYHQQALKTERPPSYGEIYPNISHVNVNRMLRQVLQKSCAGNGANAGGGNGSGSELLDSTGDSAVAGGPPTLQQMNLMQQQHQQYVTLFAQLNSSNNHQVPQMNNQLPSELSEIHYDTDIQCDIDQVIRHELNIAGTLDFSVDHFGNI